MLIPAHRMLDALQHEVTALRAQFADSNVDGSAIMSITNALQMLVNRERGGVAAIRQRMQSLDALISQVREAVGDSAPDITAQAGALRHTLKQASTIADQAELEAAWASALARMQDLAVRWNQTAHIGEPAKAAARAAMVAWEAGYLQSQAAPSASDADGVDTDITRDKLAAYLQDRFAEPGLQLTSFQPLAGGFGKQTVLFDVTSTALNGSFVMRRDIGTRPSVDNDCHRIRDEYPVIQAVFQRGFAAPDALWLDTDHRLLPGGDFIVMRRSPGQLAGNFFGARTAIPADLTDALADVMARLHTLAPLTELGDLTNAIRTDRWQLTQGECTRRYIQDWYELYLSEEHTPSPALVAIFGWLLDHVPNRPGRPSLLHGDIGYHNFLFDQGQLSAVLDWEFAHIGDPAEELGYVKVTLGDAVPWDRLMDRYVAAGGEPVDAQTQRYFQVWGYARNAAGANLLSTQLSRGHAKDLKLAILPVVHIPQFIRGAQALIEAA